MTAPLLLAALAGCLGNATPEDLAPATPPGSADAPAAPQASVLTWEGYIKANGAGEAPAHFLATEALVAPVWTSGFNFHVEEMPSVLEVMLEWTSATPSEVMFMVHAPWDASNPREWTEFEYPDHHMTALEWPSEGPVCMRIPTDQVVPGHFHTMAHSKYGADIQLTFAITTVGGKVSIPEGLHGHPIDAEELEQISQVVKTTPWLPCERSAPRTG